MLGPNPLGMTRPNPLGMPGFGIKQKRVYGTHITPNYVLCLKMSVVFHPADFTYVVFVAKTSTKIQLVLLARKSAEFSCLLASQTS